jgi:hypothetical protein
MCGAALVLVGCTTTKVLNYNEGPDAPTARNILLFMDGTSNDLNSVTNVGRLYAMAANQNRRDQVIFYTSGVGADSSSIVGMTTGFGTQGDVRQAYRFLAEHWSGSDDSVQLYAFSRGAWSGRILAAFVYVVGIIDLRSVPGERAKNRIIDELYLAYKGQGLTLQQRRERTEAVIARHGLTRRSSDTMPFKFEVMGLWDTVEALGVQHFGERVDPKNQRYMDQLCNVEHVFHAMAIDDNRSTTYTPILMSRERLVRFCKQQERPDQFKEVWFAGAHSDVGGGYSSGFLSGVSLNWMLRQVRGKGVGGNGAFGPSAAVYENPYDIIHDAQDQNLAMRIMVRQPRNLANYLDENHRQFGTDTGVGRFIRVHKSALDRIAPGASLVGSGGRIPYGATEPPKVLLRAYNLRDQFPNCFGADNGPFIGCDQIKVEEPGWRF